MVTAFLRIFPIYIFSSKLEAGPLDVSPDGKQVVFYTHQSTPKPLAFLR